MVKSWAVEADHAGACLNSTKACSVSWGSVPWFPYLISGNNSSYVTVFVTINSVKGLGECLTQLLMLNSG